MKRTLAILLSVILALTGTVVFAATQGDGWLHLNDETETVSGPEGFVHNHNCGDDGVAPAYIAPCTCTHGSIELISEPDNPVEHYWYCTCCSAVAAEAHTPRNSCYDAKCTICNFEYEDIGHDYVLRTLNYTEWEETHGDICIHEWSNGICGNIYSIEFCEPDASQHDYRLVGPAINGEHILYYPCFECWYCVPESTRMCEIYNCPWCDIADW